MRMGQFCLRVNQIVFYEHTLLTSAYCPYPYLLCRSKGAFCDGIGHSLNPSRGLTVSLFYRCCGAGFEMVNSGTLREWGLGFRNPTSLFPSLVVLKEVSSDAAPVKKEPRPKREMYSVTPCNLWGRVS